MEAFTLLPDPQTNGGLLVAVRPEGEDAVRELLKRDGWYAEPIGVFGSRKEKPILVSP
jgi:selenide,water dikinase